MATVALTKSVGYLDTDTGKSFDITASKSKFFRDGYRSVSRLAMGDDKLILEIAGNPAYSKLVYLNILNVSGGTAIVKVTSGANFYQVRVPVGRCFELQNLNTWTDPAGGGTATPDTFDTIEASGQTTSSIIKLDALFG